MRIGEESERKGVLRNSKGEDKEKKEKEKISRSGGKTMDD